MTENARHTSKDDHSCIDFLVVTQKEEGSLDKLRGWQSKVRSHSAKRQHAKERAKRNDHSITSANQLAAKSIIPSFPRHEPVTATSLLAPNQNLQRNGSSEHCGSREVPPKCRHGAYAAVCLHCLKAGPCFYQPPVVFLHNLDALSRDEKDDVIRHLQIVPTVVTGPSRDDLFQPIRDASSHMMQASPGVVDWLLAESDAIRSATDSTVLKRLHGRRLRIYRKMNEMLSHPVLRCSDDLLNMVLVATCFEYWAEYGRDLPKVRVHYRGLLDLIERRGGLATLFGCAAILGRPLNCLTHFTFSELEVIDQIEVEKSCAAFISTLEALQTLAKSRGGSLAIIKRTQFTNLQHLVHWKSTFGGITERLVHFTSLYLMAIIILDLGPRHDIAYKFWSSLSAIIDDRINSTTNATSLSPHILVWMVTRTWIDINNSSAWPGSSGPQKELWLTDAGLSALKVFGRVSDPWKDKLIRSLSSWICAGCQACDNSDEERYLNEEQLQQMASECCSSWYERRGDPLAVP